jgi:integrase
VIPDWDKKALDAYLLTMNFPSVHLFRPILKNGKINGHRLETRSLQKVVKMYAKMCGLPDIASHDLQRTYAKLAYQNCARIDQIQINLGNQSLTTAQKYLGIDLDLEDGPGNYLDIKIA